VEAVTWLGWRFESEITKWFAAIASDDVARCGCSGNWKR